MPFSVQNYTADPAGNIVTLGWTYTNADGSLSNTHKLATPAGSVPKAEATQAVLVSWLEEQLQNTVEEFDAAISKAKEQQEYQQSLVTHLAEADGSYSAVAE